MVTLKKKAIKKVEIDGNRSFSDGKIKSFLFTKEKKWYHFLSKRKYSRANARYDITQIEDFYGRNGYPFTQTVFDARLSAEDTSKVVVTFTVNEGKLVTVRERKVLGGIDKINESLGKYLNKIKVNEPINTEAVKAAVFKIKNHYADNAYPVADVAYNYDYNYDSTDVIVEFAINPNEYVYNGDVTIVRESVSGSKDFIFARELLVKRDRPYNRTKVIESQQRLYATGLLKFVTLRRTLGLNHVNPDTAYTDFRLVVNERKAYFTNIRAGIGDDPDFNTVFNASVSFGNRNLWGTGRKLIFTARNSIQLTNAGGEGIDSLQFKDLFSGKFWNDLQFKAVKNALKLDYVEPWFLAYRMPLSISTTFEPQNKNPIINKYYDRLSAETSLARELNRFTNVRLSARVEFVNIHDIRDDEQALYRQEGDNSIRRRLSIYGQRDTRDNILAPQSGSFSYTSVDYVGDILGGDFSYLRGEFYWSRFNNFVGQNVLATRINIGALKELETDGSGSDDRFTLGGAKTVRGFTENDMGLKWTEADGIDTTSSLYLQPKGGKLMILTNIEIRRPLFWRIGGTAFVDIGNVFYDVSDFKIERLHLVGGLGIQVFTPIGPIRLDRGVKLKKDLDLADGATHLTILYAF